MRVNLAQGPKAGEFEARCQAYANLVRNRPEAATW
jgi:hypothetical protein